MTNLEGHSVLELIEEHLQLAHADDKVWQAELVLHVPAQGAKLEPLLHMAYIEWHRACSSHGIATDAGAGIQAETTAYFGS